jgi:signal transduction histidine kinase
MTKQDFTDTGLIRALDPEIGLVWWRRFQSRILAYLLGLSCLSSVGAGGIYYSRQVKFVEAEQEERGKTLLSNLAGQSELGSYSGDSAFLTVPLRRVLQENDVNFAAIYSSRGEVLAQLAKPDVKVDSHVPADILRAFLGDPSSIPMRRPQREYEDLFAPVVTVQGSAEEGLFGGGSASTAAVTVGVARLGLSHRPAQQKLDEVLRWGIYLALIVLAMGALVALVLARRISRPILALARGADEVRRGSLGYQLDVRRSDELGLLAQSFNRMSSKLRETVESLAQLNRSLEEKVAHRTMALRRSRDFIALLNAPLQLNKLLDTALDALLRHADAVAGAIFLKQSTGDLELAVVKEAPETAFAWRPGKQPSFLARAAVAAAPITVEGIPDDDPLRRHCPSLTTLLCVRVGFRERLEAVLVLGLTRRPQTDLVEFVDHASSQLGIAVSNARAYQATERLAQELERRNVALLQQRDQLQEHNRLKSEFVANVSHELRTPLNAILGYGELLAEGVYGQVSSHQAQSLTGISENASNLLLLIDQILDLSRVETGKMTISLEETDLNRLVQEVVDLSAPLVKDRPYRVHAELPEGAVRVTTDRAKVRQILVNLVSNAVKFTAEGSVIVTTVATPQGEVRISVRDTGIGIRSEHQDLIFDEFRQVDGSSTRAHGGSGLGLAISKKFAALLGGDIHVESTSGRGSCFTLVLPRATIAAPSPQGEKRPDAVATIGDDDATGS